MSKLSLQIAAVVMVAATAVAFAANNKGGSAPARGGGGAPHVGGGGPHIGGGGPHIGGGGPRFSAPHISGGGARFSAPHFNAQRSSGSHPSFHTRSYSHPAFRGNIARSYSRPVFRGNDSRAIATHGNVKNLKAANIGRNAAALQSSKKISNVLNSRQVRHALHNPKELRNPHTRSLIASKTAAAGWHHGERNFEHGWWRHRHGGFGWVGPLFWPFAYYDLYDYALWGYDDSFWDYGYGDIYAGLFAPYGYDDLAGYLPQYASRGPGRGPRAVPPTELAQMCGEDSRDIAGLPVDQVQQSLRPDEQQRAALEELANASARAAQVIKAACPADVALTAPGRVDAMLKRLEALDRAVQIVEPPLTRFYGLLNDEQKARLSALDQNVSRNNNDITGSVGQNCGGSQPGVTDWPTAEIERVVHPTGAQQSRLDALKQAADQTADHLSASCPSSAPLTPPARLAAVGTRLDVMLQGVRSIRTTLNDFYNSLNDEQKAQFDAIGPQRAARG